MDKYLTLVIVLIIAITAIVSVYWTHQTLKQSWQSIQDKDLQIKRIEQFSSNRNQSFPIRLQAYERLVLLLERSKAGPLLNRLSEPGIPASVLHHAMVTALRAELEHNLSQQIYVGAQSWKALAEAQNATINLVNSCYRSCKEEASGLDLARLIFENEPSVEQLNQHAIALLKAEALSMMG